MQDKELQHWVEVFIAKQPNLNTEQQSVLIELAEMAEDFNNFIKKCKKSDSLTLKLFTREIRCSLVDRYLKDLRRLPLNELFKYVQRFSHDPNWGPQTRKALEERIDKLTKGELKKLRKIAKNDNKIVEHVDLQLSGFKKSKVVFMDICSNFLGSLAR